MNVHDLPIADEMQLRRTLDRLSNADFRRVERQVRTELLPTLPNDTFFTTLLYLIIYRPQAFLTGILAVGHLADNSTLDFTVPSARQLAQRLTPQQAQKMAGMAVPLMRTEPQVAQLLSWLGIEGERSRLAVLLQADSVPAYYHLLLTLIHSADAHVMARQCCLHILRRADDRSVNMAALLHALFQLSDVSVPHALPIHPYELSALESSYQRFETLIGGRRPGLF